MTAVTAGLGLEGHLGKALAGLAGHDFVAMPADPVQAGRAAIEGKADGVEDGALPNNQIIKQKLKFHLSKIV